MEECTEITVEMWKKWKEEIREKLQETAVNFVYIGYRLRQIQSSGMYDGAENVYEFAEKEYGIGKSTTSRFIAINERYGDPEDPMKLKEEYRNFTSSKLAEMMTLTDEECEMITEQTTISQIRALKKFEKAEIEEIELKEDQEYTPFQRCVIKWFEGKEKDLNDALGLIKKAAGLDEEEKEKISKEIVEVINPSSSGMCQKGTIFIFFYEYEKGIKYRDAKSKQSESISYEKFFKIMKKIYENVMETENPYKAFYLQEIQEEKEAEKEPQSIENTESEAVATSQQNEENSNEKNDEENTNLEEKSEEENEEQEEEEEDLSLPESEIEIDQEDTATSEEEQQNAKKLHVLKMLERYYTYMNEEELQILEDILEDCKRRKREYGFDDVGSTL